MFYFRINKLRIFDNRESGFLFFKKNLAQVKLISFVNTEADFPVLDSWVAETDQAKKKNLLAEAIQKVSSTRILTEIDNVKDDAILTFGDTGYVLYQTEKIPKDFNWCFLAVEGDDNVRKIGDGIKTIVNHSEFDNFASNVAILASSAANPAFAAGVAVSKFIINVSADIIKNNKDDQLGILYMSLNRKEHYLHGERKKDDVPDLSGNMFIDYSIFAFDE
jgi:hypothetical protein